MSIILAQKPINTLCNIKTQYLSPEDYTKIRIKHTKAAKVKTLLLDLEPYVNGRASDHEIKEALMDYMGEIKYYDVVCINVYLAAMAKLYDLSYSEQSLLFYISDSTLSHGKTLKQISYSYLTNAKYMSKRDTIHKAFKGLLDKKLIVRYIGKDKKYYYGINLEPYISKHICQKLALKYHKGVDTGFFDNYQIWTERIFTHNRTKRSAMLLCDMLSGILNKKLTPKASNGCLLTAIEVFFRRNVRGYIVGDMKGSELKKDVYYKGKILFSGLTRDRGCLSKDLKYLKECGFIAEQKGEDFKRTVNEITLGIGRDAQIDADISTEVYALSRTFAKYTDSLIKNRKSHRIISIRAFNLLSPERVLYYENHGFDDYFRLSNMDVDGEYETLKETQTQ